VIIRGRWAENCSGKSLNVTIGKLPSEAIDAKKLKVEHSLRPKTHGIKPCEGKLNRLV
jgi:hypothetical protein